MRGRNSAKGHQRFINFGAVISRETGGLINDVLAWLRVPRLVL